jgi:hypothetical protein
VLGTLASIGGKYILSARVVDVEQGFRLKADKIERPSLADMTEGAEALAYKLAGLVYAGKTTEGVVEGFGEVYYSNRPSFTARNMNISSSTDVLRIWSPNF